MTYRVAISSRASRHVLEETSWYAEVAGADVADALLNSFDNVVTILHTNPLAVPIDSDLDARHIFIPGFPLAVWYRIKGSTARVLAITHGRMSRRAIVRRIQ